MRGLVVIGRSGLRRQPRFGGCAGALATTRHGYSYRCSHGAPERIADGCPNGNGNGNGNADVSSIIESYIVTVVYAELVANGNPDALANANANLGADRNPDALANAYGHAVYNARRASHLGDPRH